ncbi:hypothetical protein [Lysobacter claricitrinus]|uniref:hypothetical protein n=1 Tax=Lysobacter claricitrinus TaxID=3367728 RepID=UPI0037DA922F
MKSLIRLAVLGFAALPAFAMAGERWYWATAQCSDAADENVYMFAAVVSIQTDEDAGGDEPQESRDSARFGFGNYAEQNYAEESCGTAEISAQNMSVSGSFDSRDEAASALDDYVADEEAKGHAWLKIVRVEDFARE